MRRETSQKRKKEEEEEEFIVSFLYFVLFQTINLHPSPIHLLRLGPPPVFFSPSFSPNSPPSLSIRPLLQFLSLPLLHVLLLSYPHLRYLPLLCTIPPYPTLPLVSIFLFFFLLVFFFPGGGERGDGEERDVEDKEYEEEQDGHGAKEQGG